MNVCTLYKNFLQGSAVMLALLSLIACGGNVQTSETNDNKRPDYPKDIVAVFDAHGGMQKWRQQQTLAFTIEDRGNGSETHTTDLYTRQSLIKSENYTIGYDGENPWIKQDTQSFRSSPKFYYNLMFYFYAMPFVLGDEGIVYTPVETVTFKDKNYNGVKISYKDGVGNSSKDEYILYYDPATHKMTWLAYTVTYFSNEKSPQFYLVHYEDWQDTDGLLLPSKMTWYQYSENKEVGDQRSQANFINVSASTESLGDAYYAMPEGAVISEE